MLKKLWLQPPRSFKYRLKVDDLAPDGVPIQIAWGKLIPGSSVFVPCIDTVECGRQIHAVAMHYDWSLDMRVVIDGGRWGIRFWRVM